MSFKICIAGKNDIAINSIKFLLKNNIFNKKDICVIINSSSNNKFGFSLKDFVKKEKITVVNIEQIYNIKDLIFVSLEYDKIIDINKFVSDRLFNIHFSKLPAYKGMYTSCLPILNGETTTGVTLHKIDSGIDTGDIIKQKVFKININDTARDLYLKYLKKGFTLFKENIENIINNDFFTYKQHIEKSSYYSRKTIDFKNIKIDLNRTSFQIHNQLRAFIFKEYQLPKIKNIFVTKTIITDNFIGYNKFIEKKDKFIISGTDGYEILVYKLLNI